MVNEKVVKALCNETRLKIIICLSNKSKTVSEIIGNCDLSQSAVSQHLFKLKQAGLVSDQKVGREVFYSIKNADLPKISSLLLNLTKEE